MNPESKHPDDAKLRALVRESRSAPELPPGFQNAVWKRIERTEAATQSHWLAMLAGWMFRPRFAAASLAAVMLLGLALGTFTSARAERADSQARYIASVNPFQKQH